MPSFHQKDLAYIHALAFGDFARGPLHVRGPVGGGRGLWRKDLDTIDSCAELIEDARLNAPDARRPRFSLLRFAFGKAAGPASTGKGARLFSKDSSEDAGALGLFRKSQPEVIFASVSQAVPVGAAKTLRGGSMDRM